MVGAADQDYLNSGDAEGTSWTVPLCDTSIRPGWFSHPEEDDKVKSLPDLLEVYYKSVGRNCVLLLNVPPDTRGQLHENDVAALRRFRRVVDETFAVDRAAGKPVQADQWRLRHEKFAPGHLVDGDPESYWATDDEVRRATLWIDLGAPTRFDRVLLQEPIRFGQRISELSVEALVDGEWVPLARATTVGYKRILRTPVVTADRVRLRIVAANNAPALSTVGLFEASPSESSN